MGIISVNNLHFKMTILKNKGINEITNLKSSINLMPILFVYIDVGEHMAKRNPGAI